MVRRMNSRCASSMLRPSIPIIIVLLGGLATAEIALAADAPPPLVSWTVCESEGNTISSGENGHEIKARTNTYAHLIAPGRDFVRLSGGIKPGAGVSWCTSLFIYWGPGDWCQIGVLQENGGTYYVTEMIAGRPTEYRLSRCDANGWCNVAVELGVDCIRYLSSPDAARWKAEMVNRRPASFNTEPTRFMAGKGYGSGAAPAAKPYLQNDFRDAGPVTTSQIRDLRVERTDYSALRATAAERQQWDRQLHDLIGEQELAADTDPSFESVARHFPAMKYPREVVGIKDHPHDIGVAFDGTLQLNDAVADPNQPVAFFEIGEPARRFGSGDRPPHKLLLDGHLPVVFAKWSLDSLNCEQTVFGYSKDLSPDSPLYGYVRLAIANSDRTDRHVKVRLCIKTGTQVRTAGEWTVASPTSSQGVVCVKIPFDIAKASAAQITPVEFEGKLAEVRRYWGDLLKTGERFTIPEQRVQDAYRAWLVYSFLNVDKRDGVYHVCDGAGFYEEIYGYSAALYCHVLDLFGYHEQTRTYLDSLLTFQQPDGLFCVNFGHTDTGTLLHVMSEHYRITGDAEWLRKVSPKMIAMCNWIISHRSESMKNIHGKRAMVHGLIRYRPYCDHELPAFDYYSNGYLWAGMADAADVVAQIGMRDEAGRLKKEADAYRKDILMSMDMAVIDHDGVRMLPMMPDTQTLLKESNYTANGYYGLIASCLLETSVIEPRDPRAQLVVDMLERRSGLVAGICQFFGQIDHAYTYGYWLNCLQRNEPKKAILGLYGSMAYGMSRDTYAGVECTAIRTGDNAPTLPHTYSCSKQLRLLRNMLLREQGNELLIGQAIPRPWLEPGKMVEAGQAPTDFGPVSFKIAADADGRQVMVDLAPPSRKPPAAIRIWLRHPRRLTIDSIRTEPKIDVVQDGDSIKLAAPVAATTIRVLYR
jgi:hypothetical protein